MKNMPRTTGLVEPSSKKQQQEMEKAYNRIPRMTSWGLFSFSDAPPCCCGSGVGAFLWFPGQKALMTYLRNFMVWDHPGPSSSSREEIATKVLGIIDEVGVERENMEVLRQRLNGYMKGLWHISWWGTFRDLCTSQDAFCAEQRQGFLECLEDYEETIEPDTGGGGIIEGRSRGEDNSSVPGRGKASDRRIARTVPSIGPDLVPEFIEHLKDCGI